MLEILEQGSIAFVYRPRVQKALARGIEDVQAFYVILVPEGGQGARRLRVGRKRLPDGRRRERFWAYVERTGPLPRIVDDLAATEYWTKTRGLRHQPGPRLAGEGAYVLGRHGAHVHLAYGLRRDRRVTEVRDELRIAAEASYIVAAFAESLPDAARGGDDARRFLPLEPAHLELPGTELVLVGGGDRTPAELGPLLEASAEDATTADLRERVRRASGRPPSAPLLDGLWH